MPTPTVFISYSHKDKDLLGPLVAQLKALEQAGLLDVWVDTRIDAQEDLDESSEIAERGQMRLFLADIHLHRARLFFREATYPWESPTADLARKLIEQCGFGRRKEELEDAEAGLRQQHS
jgi:hypothetical protein